MAGGKLKRDGQLWLADSPMGRVSIKFTERNPFFVLDHDVTVPSGQTTHNAMRVLPNGDGSEVVFTAIHAKGMTDAQFDSDVKTIRKDLTALKQRVEKP